MPAASATLTSAEIRRQFIDFFREKHGHAFVPSSPVVPHDDPTLLFTNAGMNQFKPLFLGQVDPGSRMASLRRAVNSQKCIRAGGKHNDLEDVGKDLYHHTFFEMLGNWSFGDYFKAEAIDWAWTLFTEVWGLDSGRLYATYFGGDEREGLAPDNEARDLWRRYLPAERVLPGSMKDNFWEMGDTGPCGPCSEVHYDGRPDAGLSATPGRDLVNADDPDVIELWNLVFIQFDRQPGTLKPLPAKHVDTGMGLERICRVLQGKNSNYDTDLFTPLFEKIQQVTGAPAYSGRLDLPADIAYRVIADHIRTLTFAITDGAEPSNEGRGYVLRRILRRAVRHGRQTLGASGSFLAEIVPVVIREMGEFFPELKKNPQRVADIIRSEEEAFGRTIDRGIEHFDAASKAGAIPADAAFQLHDTYGFPIDLTQVMAEERGLTVDVAGFQRLMEEARERSRAGGGKGAGDTVAALSTDAVASLQKLGVKPTDDAAKFDPKPTLGTVRAIWNGTDFDENAVASRMKPTDRVAIILDRTNCYAEMGGQVGDTGRMRVTKETRSSASNIGDPGEGVIEDTQIVAGFVLHLVRLKKGEFRVGDTVECRVDDPRRQAIARNHTATHLLNLALRDTIGSAVDQKGSLVAPDRLRFDFTADHALTADEVAASQTIVRDAIQRALPVFAEVQPLDSARQINGLRAVFGEAYPDPVRVVSIGAPVADLVADPGNEQWGRLSIEFCGGTHLISTADARAFAITEEEAVARGVRRIVALTGQAAEDAIDLGDRLVERAQQAAALDDSALDAEVGALLAELERATVPLTDRARVREAIEALQERLKKVRKASAKAGREQAVEAARALAAAAGDGAIVSEIPAGGDRQALLAAMDAVRSKHEAAPIMLISRDEDEGKVLIVASCPESSIKAGLKAGDWVRTAAEACGGKGGGRPDSAQGGGTDLAKIPAAIRAAEAFASDKVG
jgi:alanyl-tRNA synthetase